MRVQGLNLQESSGAVTRYRTITNATEAIKQAKEKIVTTKRDEYIPSGRDYNEAGNFIVNEDIFFSREKTCFGNSGRVLVNEDNFENGLPVPVNMGKLDTAAFMGKSGILKLNSNSEFRTLSEKNVEYYFLTVGYENNGVNSMASTLQDRLDEIDDSADLTDEEKSLLRSVWKEGFTNAVGFQLSISEDLSEALANGNVQDLRGLGSYIGEIAKDFADSDFSTEIKDLLFDGLDKMINNGSTVSWFLIRQRPVFLGGDPRNFVYMQRPLSSDINFLNNIVTETRNEIKN